MISWRAELLFGRRTAGWRNELTRTTNFNKGESQVLHLGQSNSMHRYRLGVNWIDSNFAEKDLGDLLESRLNVSQQCALSAKRFSHILGFVNKNVASMSAAVITTLSSEPGETTSKVLFPVLNIQE